MSIFQSIFLTCYLNTLPSPSDHTLYTAAAVAQWVRAFASQAEGWVFESKPRHTLVVKIGSDSPTPKRSALSASVTDPRRLPI